MYNLSDTAIIKDILGRHGFSFSKSLGQNFLVNPSVCPKMAELAGLDENTGVLEIGPGIGVLTSELAKRAKKAVAVELDSRLLPVLGETLSDFDNVEIINADVMKIDLSSLIKEKFGDMRVCVCANLPYYITSPVIMLLLESRLPIDSITVMVQKEAAQRLTARVGSRESGAVTVAVDYYSEAVKLFDVSRGSFLPPPNVDSAVIQLKVRETPPVSVSDEKLFFAMVKAAFAQRRKTAVNSVSSGLGISKQTVAAALQKSGLSVNARAESLSMQELAALCENIKTETENQ
ncbi:MAG: 16S rRNA (adenine(1518)-N(6)/adenine(1519)-N(6))-dimethyltransferase RsmA [Clostridia bacterium]|nr:16S rRNA (adenine(1518)-N(6)/adenine(1519)-N(6))-dimethyltransferase RsmA [Clostridia bacterium]